MASVDSKVITIIADRLGVSEDQIKPDTNIANDLGADSLDLAELMIAFEEEFDINIVEEDTQHITTVKSVIDHIQAAVSANG